MHLGRANAGRRVGKIGNGLVFRARLHQRPMARTSTIFALLLAATLPTVDAWAQTLTPEQALRTTVEKNPQMSELGLVVREAELDAEAQESLRPFTLRGDAGVQHDEQPTADVLTEGVRRTTAVRASAELLKQFVIGTSLSLRLDLNRSVSQVPFTVPDLNISEIRTIGPNYFTGLTLGAQQPLLRGFGSEIGNLPLDVAQQQVEIAELRRRATATDLVAESLDAYWRWVRAALDLRAQTESLERTKVLSEATLAQIEAGQLAELERDIVEQRIAAAEQGIVASEAALIDAGESLRKTMGLTLTVDEGFAPPTDIPVDTEAIPPVATAIELAARSNPQLALLRQEVEANRLQVIRSKDLVKPQLDAIGTVGQLGLSEDPLDSLAQVGTLDFTTLFIGLQFAVPLDNKLARKQLEADEIAVDAAERRYEQSLREIELVLRQARRLLETQKRRLALSEKEIALARKNLAAMQAKFDAGLASYLEVLQLEEDLSGAEARYNQARIDVVTARVAFERVTGTLLDRWGVEVE